jgi:hypothetical protein
MVLSAPAKLGKCGAYSAWMEWVKRVLTPLGLKPPLRAEAKIADTVMIDR